MKRNILGVLCTLGIAAAILQPGGVAGQSKPAKPASVVSLNDMKKQLMMVQSQVAGTMGSLNRIKDAAKDPAGLPKALADYEANFKTLDAHVEITRAQGIASKARAKAHYEAWQKELMDLDNPQIREKALARFAQSKEEFDKIIATAERAKEELLPFVSDMKDVLLYLQADLSDEAVKSLSNTIWKLGNRSKAVIGSIGDVNEQIDRTIKSLPVK